MNKAQPPCVWLLLSLLVLCLEWRKLYIFATPTVPHNLLLPLLPRWHVTDAEGGQPGCGFACAFKTSTVALPAWNAVQPPLAVPIRSSGNGCPKRPARSQDIEATRSPILMLAEVGCWHVHECFSMPMWIRFTSDCSSDLHLHALLPDHEGGWDCHRCSGWQLQKPHRVSAAT
jgi:hypothetical protein